MTSIYPSKTNLINQPVLIIGTPRSGKSMLGHILKSSDLYYYNGEALDIWNIGKTLSNSDVRSGSEATIKIQKRIKLKCTKKAYNFGKRNYLDAVSYNMLRIPFIHTIFPEAKIIHVFRNGETAIPEILYGWANQNTPLKTINKRRRHVNALTIYHYGFRFIQNYQRAIIGKSRSSWGPNFPSLQAFRQVHSIEETAAFQWSTLITIASEELSKLPNDAWLSIRYEDLVENTKTTLDKVGKFCGLEDLTSINNFANNFINFTNPPSDVQSWKVTPSIDKWKLIRKIILPIQEQLGYW